MVNVKFMFYRFCLHQVIKFVIDFYESEKLFYHVIAMVGKS